jgi:hypothetical protein
MMEVSSLLSLPDGLEVASMVIADTVLRIHVVATTEKRACPLCNQEAAHIRS